jgi:hypothetical protein
MSGNLLRYAGDPIERDNLLAPGPAPSMPMGPPDFSARYNTALTPTEEAQFQQWAQASGKAGDLRDYDLRGAWKSGAATAPNGHLPDTYKKPNHPTFSDESQYHGRDGFTGGTWGGGDGQPDTFTPGPTNLRMLGPQGLQHYFHQREPDVRLMLPPQRMSGGDSEGMPPPGPDPSSLTRPRDMPQVPPTSWLDWMVQHRSANLGADQNMLAPGAVPTWNGGSMQDAPFAIDPPRPPFSTDRNT